MSLVTIIAAVALAVVLPCLYLYKLNRAMYAVPQDACEYSPHRWTDEEIRETYERVCKEPVDYGKFLPPRLQRRYIVVGGSGLVGGDIVLQLLQRGQPASSIRILDFVPPSRPDLLTGSAKDVDFGKADISDANSTFTAFDKPWPSSVAELPLTVFHTAAIIRPYERTMTTWDRTEPVNVTGTRNSLSAAKKAGASIFIFTSSVSVATRNCSFLTIAPWASHPRNAVQLLDESDFDHPVRPRGDFFANYAYSKALSERLVGSAHTAAFRTGCLRPGGGIYGLPKDIVYEDGLRRGRSTSFARQVIQNVVSAWNVSLAHLQFEAALAPRAADVGAQLSPPPACAGRPFVITDPGPPPAWADFFRAAALLSVTPVEVVDVPPLPLYLLSFAVEAWAELLARFPGLKRLGLREPAGDLLSLQPGVFTAMVYIMCVDDRARKSVEEGGIGYRGGVNSLEGTCELLRDWNRLQEAKGRSGK